MNVLSISMMTDEELARHIWMMEENLPLPPRVEKPPSPPRIRPIVHDSGY